MYSNILNNWFYGEDVQVDDMKLLTKSFLQLCFAANGGNVMATGITPTITGNNIATTKGFVYFGETSDAIFIERTGTNQLLSFVDPTSVPLIANGYLYVKPIITYDVNNRTSTVSGVVYTSTNAADEGINLATITNSVITQINSINPFGATQLQRGITQLATQAEVNTGTVTNKIVAPSTFAASTQLASKANANNIHFAGDTKLSFQAANHASGNGMWMIANGQSIPTQYTQAIAIFGATLPNITDAVIGVAGGSHLSGTSYGANAVAVPVSSHYHGMLLYNGHTHGLTAYNAHYHSINHGHTASQDAHAHVVGAGAPVTQAGLVQGGAYINEVFISRATSNTDNRQPNVYVTAFSGSSAAGSGVGSGTDVVNNANSRTDDTGTAGVTISVLQPTYYTKNLFIFCC